MVASAQGLIGCAKQKTMRLSKAQALLTDVKHPAGHPDSSDPHNLFSTDC